VFIIFLYLVKDLRPELPFQQQGLQRSNTEHPNFNNLGLLSQVNGALSYRQNEANHKAVLPIARKIISRKNLNPNPLQALNILNSAKNRQQYYMSPDPQRYYSEQSSASAIKHPYSVPITVGQPLLRPSPLAFHQQTTTGSTSGFNKLRLPQGDQPANPDLNLDKDKAQTGNRHYTVPNPVKLVLQDKDEHIEDDIEGRQDGAKDEATEIGDVQSDPIPSDTSFTENTKLETEEKNNDSEQNIDSSIEQVTPNTNSGSSQQSNDDGLATAGNNVNPDSNTQSNEGGIHDDIMSDEKENEPNKLNEYLKPASNANNEVGQGKSDVHSYTTSQGSSSLAKQANPSTKSEVDQSEDKGGVAINLDVLKNKIAGSKDVGFLKRMLTLIKKITHHKDFNKLAGMQKNAIVQAGKAVKNAVKTESTTQRSFIQPRPANVSPDVNYAFHGRPGYGGQSVNSYISSVNQRPHPPNWNPGDRTVTGSTHAQFYKAGQREISKKFQIERNPYYQQQSPRRVSYTPPYFSLQRLNYGIYNGNMP
jgi:hypothetical protein